MALAKDQTQLAGTSRAVSRRTSGKVLFADTFDVGGEPTFNHWRQHWGNGAPYVPPGLSRYPALDAYALKLSTPERPVAQIPVGQQGFSVYKNLSRYFTEAEAGYISFSGYFAAMPGRAAPGANWSIGIDSQMWGSTDRSFFKASCRYPGGNAAQWYLSDNSGTSVALPGSERHTAGINQEKANWNYVELTVNLVSNGGRGAYHALKVNDKTFDLTDTSVWSDPTQSGRQAIQGSTTNANTSPQHLLDFDGGLNFGIFGSAPGDAASYPFRLYAARLTGTIYEAA